jgi:hypothetical protein
VTGISISVSWAEFTAPTAVLITLTTKGFRNGRSPRHTHRLRCPQQDRFEVQESWIDRVVVLSVCDAVDMQRSTVDGSDT